MSFREKSAWITLVSVLACFGVYFFELVASHGQGRHLGALRSLHLLLLAVAALVALQLALTAIAAATTAKDERAADDERERMIQWRSRSLGYHVLLVLALVPFVALIFGHSAVDMANFALLAVVISALVVAVAQIVMFRRGY
ncbi:MAG: hypothetical protein ACJ798_17760 [Phenylobacterium sp.]